MESPLGTSISVYSKINILLCDSRDFSFLIITIRINIFSNIIILLNNTSLLNNFSVTITRLHYEGKREQDDVDIVEISLS